MASTPVICPACGIVSLAPANPAIGAPVIEHHTCAHCDEVSPVPQPSRPVAGSA